MERHGKDKKTADVATKHDKTQTNTYESLSERLEKCARKAIGDASIALININLFDDIIPFADSEIQWPDYGSVREAFKALAEHGMTRALVRLSDELMCETKTRGRDWIKSDVISCLDVARSAVIASNMNPAHKNAFLRRVKRWKRSSLMRDR